jgi:hypothetical protein
MHRGVISRTVVGAASALALAGCECLDCGGFSIGDEPRSALLALARADAAAPAPAVTTIPVRYDQSRTARIAHPDAGTTLFVELFFPSQSILHANGQPVCDTCTVTVTVTATAGVYGFTLSPANLIFNASSTPTVTFGHGTYGDLSVHDSSTRYATEQSFDQALAVYYEASPNLWRRGRNSTRTGPGTVASGIDTPGAHMLAAPK